MTDARTIIKAGNYRVGGEINLLTGSTQCHQRIREGVKRNVFFRTLSQTMGRWGSKVLNFLVKITIQLF